MPIDLYQRFSNPRTGESFRCLQFNEDAFVCEFIVDPKGAVPFEHIHLNQDEIFHVKSGEIRLVIDGVEVIGKPGESIVVPMGTRHIAYNNKPETLKCIVEYKPGLDNYQFFQCFAGLTLDNDMDQKGQINIPKMLYFTKKMKARCIARPTSIPSPIFRLAIEICFIIGRFAGWEKLFNRYTDIDSKSSVASRIS
jgi:mannose-6-phosphate isomerase-like protein (cupin superfamily)